MIEIFISGTTGVCKTVVANAIKLAAEQQHASVSKSDHALFSSSKDYLKLLAHTRARHTELGSDVSIIVVNDGKRRLSSTALEDGKLRWSFIHPGFMDYRDAAKLFGDFGTMVAKKSASLQG